jgi:hypothetical protein
MQKRPNDSNETRYCLTNDDTDLRVTICHIRENQFRTGAHILPFSECFVDVNSAIATVETRCRLLACSCNAFTSF